MGFCVRGSRLARGTAMPRPSTFAGREAWPASAALFPTRSEVSCKSLEGREGLRQLIFHVTCSMKDVGSTIGCQRLAGRLVGAQLAPPASLRGDPAPHPVSASPGSAGP